MSCREGGPLKITENINRRFVEEQSKLKDFKEVGP